MAGKTIKIAISLPAEMLEAAERERRARRESRSEFFRHAVEVFLRQERQREAVRRYVEGYREQPETDQEVAAAQQVSLGTLGREPWE